LGLARSSKRKALTLALPWQEISAAWPCLTSFKSGAIARRKGITCCVHLLERLKARLRAAKPGRRPVYAHTNALWHHGLERGGFPSCARSRTAQANRVREGGFAVGDYPWGSRGAQYGLDEPIEELVDKGLDNGDDKLGRAA